MPINIVDDIHSITELKRNTNGILDQVHKTCRPVILTLNGKPEAVLLDPHEYQKMVSSFNMLKMLIPAEEEINAGKIKEAKTFFKDFRHENKI